MWYWTWGGWALAFVVSFACLEGYALYSPTGMTLSRVVYNASLAWPFLMGLVAGGLAVHFWWHWTP